MKALFVASLVAITFAAIGCQERNVAPVIDASPSATSSPSKTNADSAAVPQYSPYPTKPQRRLQTIKLWMGTNEVNAELAISQLEIMTGMMWRTNMAEMDGMLFVFGAPHQVGFWMKNTLLPLSCAYIDSDGVIQEIYPMEPQNTNAIQSVSHNIQYVLEMNRDWFSRHGVNTGAVIRTELGSFAETFVRR